jgi:hypothetical protein
MWNNGIEHRYSGDYRTYLPNGNFLSWMAGYKRTKAIDDYMVAGRNIHPYILALSYGLPSSARLQ